MRAGDLVLFIPALPFLGFLIVGLGGRRLPRAAVNAIACGLPIAAFLLAAAGFLDVLSGESARAFAWTWIRAGDLQADFALRFDKLSAVMALVVTGVGSLIHVYSTGYMRDDPGYARYFAYLNLFTAAMLVLVLADNLLLLFLGWEGVGLCSYLLIGFWFEDLSNCAAAVKAFVVNRIGDLGFLLGIFLAFFFVGSLDLGAINEAAPKLDPTWVTILALLLFVGATGKSAQIPLYVWLPDAMAGPTPVSALIHAATMVTAGVYMVVRLSGLYAAAPIAGHVIAAIGVATALFAALIACSQTDIKKVLAYSTISQLGYMFLGAGVGAYAASIFHLVTHAFFKALLFLGAGAVIHALHHEQDMRRMGGLRRHLPHTFAVFTIGALALAGFPLTAGFFSKDSILHAAHERGYTLHWILGLFTALLTAFYIFRQVAIVFLGPERGRGSAAEGEGGGEPHAVKEPPLNFRVPLYALAVLSLLGGFLPVEGFLGVEHPPFAELLGGWILGGAVAVAGVAAGLLLYTRGRALLERAVREYAPLRFAHRLSYNKFYVDEMYQALVVRPLYALAHVLFLAVDRFLIDWVLVGGSGFLARTAGYILRRIQNGKIPAYTMWFLAGALGLLAFFWFSR